MNPQLKLFKASRENNIADIKTALEEGASLEVRNDAGEDALMISVKAGAILASRFLLEQGANTDCQDQDLRTSLHWAVIRHDIITIELLLHYQASLLLADAQGKTAVELARMNQFTDVIRIFHNVTSGNYHADLLALRKNINLIADDEDLISWLDEQLPLAITKITDKKIIEGLKKIKQQLAQPETLLQWSALATKHEPIGLLIVQEKARLLSQCKNLKSMDHEFFAKINALLVDINKILQPLLQAKDDLSVVLTTNLQKLKEFYVNYCNSIVGSMGESRLEICLGRLRIRGFFGFRYLNHGIALRFYPYMNDSDAPDSLTTRPRAKRDNPYGSHPVINLFDTFYKLSPTAPAIEHAVDSLNKIMSGQGSTATELLTISQGSNSLALMASKAVKGENFLQVVLSRPEKISNLDSFNYTANVILSMLVCSADAKADNFIAEAMSGSEAFRLIGIDNDLAFGAPILLQGGSPQKHSLALKSIFFCMPQIEQPINKAYRQAFLRQPPILLILKWLKSLVLQEARYLQYLQHVDKLSNDDVSDFSRNGKPASMGQLEFKSLRLPVKFLRQAIDQLHAQLMQLHHILKTQPHVTHHQLLLTLYPAVAHYYAKVRAKPLDLHKKMVFIYGGDSNSFEEVFADQPLLLAQIQSYKRTEEQIENETTQNLTASCTEFFNNIDYKQVGDIYLQANVLEKISTDFTFIRDLTFRNCDALNDERLETLAHRLDRIETMTIINCQHLNGSGLTALLCHHPKVKITLEDFSQISSLHLLHIIQYANELNLVIKGKKYSAKEHARDLLRFALQNNYHNLVTALLLSGAHLGKEQTDSSPLHLMCEEGNFSVVNELLAYGSQVDVLDKDKRRPLDIAYTCYQKSQNQAIQQNYYFIILALVTKGAILCKESAAILDLLLHSSLKDTHRDVLFKFASCHTLLTEKNLPHLIAPTVTTLTLGSTPEMERADLTLSVPLIQALAKHAPYLSELTIMDCDGFSPTIFTEIKKIKSLLSLSIDFSQAEACKLLSLDTLSTAHELNQENLRIRVVSLKLNGRILNQNQLLNLGTFLRKTNHLRSLELINCGLDLTKVKLFASNLGRATTLERIMINRNPMGEEGGNALLKELIKLPRLTYVALDFNQLTAGNGEMLGDFIFQSPMLSHFSIFGNQLQDTGIEVMARRLQEHDKNSYGNKDYSNFKHLVLNTVGMGNTSALILGRVLLFYKNLEVLDIGYNEQLSDAGLAAFIELQEANPRLKYTKAFDLRLATPRMLAKIRQLNYRNQSLYQEDALQSYQSELEKRSTISYVENVLPSEYLAIQSLQAYNAYLRSLADLRMQEVRKASSNAQLGQKSLAQTQLLDEWGKVNISFAISPTDLNCKEELGKGTFGTVYRGVYDFAPVAIKKVNADAINSSTIEEILLECSIMAPLRSPYIVQLYGVCLEKPHYAIVMEYVPKGSLMSFIYTKKNPEDVSWDIRKQISLDIAYGMAYLHKHNVIHADLKSLNVLLDNQLRAKIADFGISKTKHIPAGILTQDPSQGETLLGNNAPGSFAWMAPELFCEKPRTTTKTDSYSFGMVLWEIAARKEPFSRKSNLQILSAWMRGDGIQETIPENTPPSIAKLIRHCWSRDPAERPTMSKAVEDLQSEVEEVTLKPITLQKISSS